MGRHPGFTVSDETKRKISQSMAAARARKFRDQGMAPPPPKRDRPKRNYSQRSRPEAPPIAPDTYSAAAVAPDMKNIDRSPQSKRARWRSLEGQITRMIEELVGLRMQLQQMAQEETV